MRMLYLVLVAALALISLAAGAAKLVAAPGEVDLLAAAGLGTVWLWPLGILQVVGAVLAAIARTRSAGLIGIAMGFAVSCLVIFLAGNVAFGLVAVVPVALAAWAWRVETR
jgi:uncharacterized membrane protein YhdT